MSDLVAYSSAMRAALRTADRVAVRATPVLITGESGTGKEMVARYVHERSPRATRPFLAVNCAALPRDLIETELFGHERGAFTGAIQQRLGRFERARGGTLLLDEIGDLPLDLQAKLLRVLQEREIERVGEMATVPVDVRIIAATNRDLIDMVRAGLFRDDLYYRLSVVPIYVSPLRERTEDIPALVEFFMSRYDAGRTFDLSEAARVKLMTYPWPGNVRELENAIHRAVLLCDGGTIHGGDLGLDAHPAPTPPSLVGRTWAEVERQLILDTVAACKGNRAQASKLLGISRRTIYARLHEYGEPIRGHA